MNEEIKFKCDECGKLFDPDPDSMVECHLSPEVVSHEEAEAYEAEGGITPEQLAAMDETALREIGLTADQREKLLNGEDITSGGMCICVECQDRLDEEQGGSSA